MFLPLLLSLACADPLEVGAVAPAELPAGQDLEVRGRGFGRDTSAALAVDGEAVALERVEVRTPTLLGARVPETVRPGTYDLVIAQEARRVVLSDAVTVVPPPVDLPCGGEFTSNTQLSLARKEIVVDRFFKSGERETVRVPLPDIARVEYELLRKADGALCSVIFVRRQDGTRLIFDDDTRVDLRERAKALGRDMGRPVEVVRMDADRLDGPGTDGAI